MRHIKGDVCSVCIDEAKILVLKTMLSTLCKGVNRVLRFCMQMVFNQNSSLEAQIVEGHGVNDGGILRLGLGLGLSFYVTVLDFGFTS